MADPVVYTGYPDVLGYIDNNGPTAYDQSAPAEQYVGETPQGGTNRYRAYYSFDTAGIPHAAKPSGGSLNVWLDAIAVPGGITILDCRMRMHYDHDRIGAAVTTDDWAMSVGSTWFGGVSPSPQFCTFNIWSSVVEEQINRTGDTDFEIWDKSLWSDASYGPRFTLRAGEWDSQERCYLTVNYRVQGVGGRLRGRNMVIGGMGPLVQLFGAGAFPEHSRVIGVDVDDLLVEARFLPRGLEGA